MDGLTLFNSLSDAEMKESFMRFLNFYFHFDFDVAFLVILFRCCSCQLLADKMTKLAPFRSVDELHNLLSSVWDQLFADDENVIFEAISSHPRIGDRQTLEKVRRERE